MKLTNTKTRIRSNSIMKKVTKHNNNAEATAATTEEIISISLKHPQQSVMESKEKKPMSDIYRIAKRFKSRLSNVAKRLSLETINKTSKNVITSATDLVQPENSNSSFSPKELSSSPFSLCASFAPIDTNSLPSSSTNASESLSPIASVTMESSLYMNSPLSINALASLNSSVSDPATDNTPPASTTINSPSVSMNTLSSPVSMDLPVVMDSPVTMDSSSNNSSVSMDTLSSSAPKALAPIDTCSASLPDTPQASPVAAKSMLSTADWSDNNNNSNPTSSLRNLQILKQYLTFISQETSSISLDNGSINMTFPSNDQTNESNTPVIESDICKSSRLGAKLIELTFNEPSITMDTPYNRELVKGFHLKSPNQATRSNRRRRPGRPPKSTNKVAVLNDDNTLRMQHKRNSIIQRQHKLRQPLKHKKDIIKCICEASSEEFGTMVQCDDCSHWLHLECLGLDEKALEETFRCPSCYIKLGSLDENNIAKLISSITWRYAAKFHSEVLAGAAGAEEEDEEDESDEEMEIDSEEEMAATSTMGIAPAAGTTTATDATSTNNDAPTSSLVPTGTSSGVAPSMLDIRFEDAGSPGADWADSLSESYSASQDGYSEAGTPSEYHFGGDDFWFAPPSAANVFLWENNGNNMKEATTSTLSTTNAPSADIEPSAVCAQELPEFNFWDAIF